MNCTKINNINVSVESFVKMLSILEYKIYPDSFVYGYNEWLNDFRNTSYTTNGIIYKRGSHFGYIIWEEEKDKIYISDIACISPPILYSLLKGIMKHVQIRLNVIKGISCNCRHGSIKILNLLNRKSIIKDLSYSKYKDYDFNETMYYATFNINEAREYENCR